MELISGSLILQKNMSVRLWNKFSC